MPWRKFRCPPWPPSVVLPAYEQSTEEMVMRPAYVSTQQAIATYAKDTTPRATIDPTGAERRR
ncbi:hypothetical protein GCM10023195_22080 [Actinoallomurus liliacearum]|uniref:Uncharacterized protein n=1 Tax=Actinoallomurus liliacearum TaxID=1080073 RepID=A0ABP8TEG1_9ACTN